VALKELSQCREPFLSRAIAVRASGVVAGFEAQRAVVLLEISRRATGPGVVSPTGPRWRPSTRL
jgi:hypothetical protein